MEILRPLRALDNGAVGLDRSVLLSPNLALVWTTPKFWNMQLDLSGELPRVETP